MMRKVMSKLRKEKTGRSSTLEMPAMPQAQSSLQILSRKHKLSSLMSHQGESQTKCD